ncbi:hypothetical protein [uncultured Duncaniella sp.]|uniref:hypothetical protein n=1 Tax=uncultured Duncaniella sp. TaxID=2768039 RepID=UPI002618A0DF|nr:hypothetical protein [uncultured Duncaniella sp.]
MKLRTLLPCAFLAATLSASAAYPIYFRDSGNIVDKKIVPENGGHFEFPIDEEGNAVFDEEGAITATVNKYGESGIWLRTKTLTENCPEEYCIFAFDYKSNRDINNLVVFHHEYAGRNDVDQISGSVLTVSDNWQTVYIPFNRKLNNWGFNVPAEKNYLWISSNDGNAKAEGWAITIKNLRMLTTAEATDECKNAPVTGDIPDAFWLPNADLTADYDEDMQNTLYARTEGAPNPLLWTGNIIRPLPASATTFAFDYKLTGDSFVPALWLTAINTGNTLPLEGLGENDPYEADWKTIKFDFADQIKSSGWGQTFGCNDFIQLQMQALGEDQLLWIKNVRWMSDATSGIEDITITPERPADDRIFNIMGVECKAPLAPGIYIQNGKKFIVK